MPPHLSLPLWAWWCLLNLAAGTFGLLVVPLEVPPIRRELQVALRLGFVVLFAAGGALYALGLVVALFAERGRLPSPPARRRGGR